MSKYILVSVEAYVALVAVQVALAGVLVALLLFRWPVVAGLVLAGLVSALMLVSIYQIVTSTSSVAGGRYQPPSRDADAPVDGVPVKEVEVLR